MLVTNLPDRVEVALEVVAVIPEEALLVNMISTLPSALRRMFGSQFWQAYTLFLLKNAKKTRKIW